MPDYLIGIILIALILFLGLIPIIGAIVSVIIVIIVLFAPEILGDFPVEIFAAIMIIGWIMLIILSIVFAVLLFIPSGSMSWWISLPNIAVYAILTIVYLVFFVSGNLAVIASIFVIATGFLAVVVAKKIPCMCLGRDKCSCDVD